MPVPEMWPPDLPGNRAGPSGRAEQDLPFEDPDAASRSPLRDVLLFGVVLGVSLGLGYAIASRSGSLLHNKMLPWIMGRTMGVAAYLTLTALVAAGIWLRHPWRTRVRSPRPETLLRAHVALAAATVALLIGHMTSLALDKYAGVGWSGTLVPWHAQYRPTAVALGTLALYAMVLVAGTAVLAGSIARKVWFPIHSVSAAIFCLCVVHGVLAGSDGHALRWIYVATGALVVVVQVTRWSARYAGGRSELEPL
jgi:sulfoxide reductase heme-binding subunit YedZ